MWGKDYRAECTETQWRDRTGRGRVQRDKMGGREDSLVEEGVELVGGAWILEFKGQI